MVFVISFAFFWSFSVSPKNARHRFADLDNAGPETEIAFRYRIFRESTGPFAKLRTRRRDFRGRTLPFTFLKGTRGFAEDTRAEVFDEDEDN